MHTFLQGLSFEPLDFVLFQELFKCFILLGSSTCLLHCCNPGSRLNWEPSLLSRLHTFTRTAYLPIYASLPST
jgi:hypothetical protein